MQCYDRRVLDTIVQIRQGHVGHGKTFAEPRLDGHVVPKKLGPERFGLGWTMQKLYEPLMSDGATGDRAAMLDTLEQHTSFAIAACPGKPLNEVHVQTLACAGLGKPLPDDCLPAVAGLDLSGTTQSDTPLAGLVDLVLEVAPDGASREEVTNRIAAVAEIGAADTEQVMTHRGLQLLFDAYVGLIGGMPDLNRKWETKLSIPAQLNVLQVTC